VISFPVMNAWFRRWWPSLLVMAIIFAASGTPGPDLPTFGLFDLFVKKGGHMLGYALLAVAYSYGLSHSKITSLRILLLAVVMAGLYAVSDEFHQSFTPGRTPLISDVGIDTLGAALGAGTWVWIRSLRAV
jgi:VanZ like protein